MVKRRILHLILDPILILLEVVILIDEEMTAVEILMVEEEIHDEEAEVTINFNFGF